jgi:hypothetical protein
VWFLRGAHFCVDVVIKILTPPLQSDLIVDASAVGQSGARTGSTAQHAARVGTRCLPLCALISLGTATTSDRRPSHPTPATCCSPQCTVARHARRTIRRSPWLRFPGSAATPGRPASSASSSRPLSSGTAAPPAPSTSTPSTPRR